MANEKTASTILLGAALTTINPPLGLPLVGYPNARPNTGVGMDLCARVMVFGDVQTQAPRAAVVVLDTLGVTPALVKGIREAIAAGVKGLDPAAVMVAATHTHSAPTLYFRQFRSGGAPEETEKYAEQTVKAAGEAAAAAWANHTEVAVKLGRTEVRIGHNRRVVDPAGVAVNNWFDVEGTHPGFFNPNVRVLSFEKDGKVRALLSFYACHPVTLGPGNAQASADYPGYFAQAIEKAIPGCFVIHITGAAGQINPRDGLADGPDKAAAAGETLAKAVLQEMSHLRPIATTPLRVVKETLTLPLGKDSKQNYSQRADDSSDGKTMNSEVQVLRIGEVAIISAPGELFGELGMAIENSSPFGITLIAGYANDNLGYLCTDTARREGGYEPRNEISQETEAILLKTAHRALVAAKAE